MDLFDANLKKHAPLAERLRPDTLDGFLGQGHLLEKGKMLRAALEGDAVPSMIFWGPPGCGKTTLARIIATMTHSDFIQFSAVSTGVKELREIITKAKDNAKLQARRTILFIDEIHRWNKAQQDALLPQIEDGTIILIGATTENPSFEVNSALLSRCRVFVLEKLSGQNIADLLVHALKNQEKGFGGFTVKADPEAIKYLASMADGDARSALNALELAVTSQDTTGEVVLDKVRMKEALQRSHLLYDTTGEQHYNIISALHKSLRGSDADAALYWLGRMLEAGEDPLYVARRLVRFASEDVGVADPNALVQAVAGYQAAHFIGMPECNVILAQVVVYLAKAKKSNDLYTAYQAVQADVKESANDPVPLHLRNAPTKLMKELGYGKDYKYNPDHDYQGDIQEYLPANLKGKKYLKK
ncbi:replication-associated recombination protein A [Candidatus Falkowbacteria bacterium]|nr:replication-associated recombination protein A [Candidatus Falkowbacteria bacterium]